MPLPTSTKARSCGLIISSTVGGGYDLYARTIADISAAIFPATRQSSRRTCRAPAASRPRTTSTACAPKDGTVIAAIQNTVPFEPFFENKAALFDATKLNWLGTPTTEVGMYIVYHTSKIKNLHDAQTMEMIAGGAGAASTPAFYGRIFNQIFHLKAKLVTGYPGQNEILLAMENGEVEAMPSPFWSSLKVARPKWFPEGTVRVLFQYGAQPHPELKGVPFALDLLDNAADKILLTAASAPLASAALTPHRPTCPRIGSRRCATP